MTTMHLRCFRRMNDYAFIKDNRSFQELFVLYLFIIIIGKRNEILILQVPDASSQAPINELPRNSKSKDDVAVASAQPSKRSRKRSPRVTISENTAIEERVLRRSSRIRYQNETRPRGDGRRGTRSFIAKRLLHMELKNDEYVWNFTDSDDEAKVALYQFCCQPPQVDDIEREFPLSFVIALLGDVMWHNVRNSLEEERMACTVDLSMLIKLEFLVHTRYVAFSGYSIGLYQRDLLGERKVAWAPKKERKILHLPVGILKGSGRFTVLELAPSFVASAVMRNRVMLANNKLHCRSILQLSSEYFSTISITIALDDLSKVRCKLQPIFSRILVREVKRTLWKKRKNFSDFNEILSFERELKRIYKRLGMKFKMSQSVRSRIGGNSSVTGALPALSVEKQSSSVHRMGDEIMHILCALLLNQKFHRQSEKVEYKNGQSEKVTTDNVVKYLSPCAAKNIQDLHVHLNGLICVKSKMRLNSESKEDVAVASSQPSKRRRMRSTRATTSKNTAFQEIVPRRSSRIRDQNETRPRHKGLRGFHGFIAKRQHHMWHKMDEYVQNFTDSENNLEPMHFGVTLFISSEYRIKNGRQTN
ncbi:hypothetical protein M9H77_01408 [Catharanthus roseus]|uniref:Uncharacterized protein n=1 Tax=Catharanthus roseus TaxID=4058 RepID=A0ACC0C5I4_CATRO|nr:hypothetical protein M9H77_01408 [Catharanthus roseus]